MEVSNPACSGPGRIAVQVNVAQTTTPEIIISKPICEGSRMTLEVTGISPNATVKWYDSETGTTLLHEGTKFITPELYVSTSYYAEVTNSACSNIAGRLEGRVVVNTTPSTVITQPSAICAGNTISISATPSTGAIIRWYKNRDDAVPDASGNSYNPTDPLYGNKKFYVEAFDPVTGCYSARDSVEVTVYAIPQLTIDAPGVCPDDKAVITVQTDPDVTVSWYENIGDADPIAKGTTFTSSAGITEEKTYYVEAVNNVTGCRSDRLSVTVSILNCTMPVNPHVRSSYISK